jgi:muramoyltetrapeptide carboxypeptidase
MSRDAWSRPRRPSELGHDGPVTSPTSAPLTAAVRPPRLRDGDVVALVAPAGPVPHDQLDAGSAVLESWGLQVRLMPHVRDVHPVHEYLAGSDEARAEDFSAAWAASDVRAIVCVRGGYGSQRMLDLVDWSALRTAEPKVLVGYSDVTALHQAIATELGVVTLHGPMSGTGSFVNSSAAQEHLRATLFEPESVQVLVSPSARPLVGGVAVGVTTGGCVSMLTTSVATPTSQTARNGLVLLEDVDEKAYRIDSYLIHLRRSGWFDGAAGVVLGSWADCEPVEDVITDVLGDLGVPILGDLGFGHGADSITVPLGVVAELDADAGQLTLDQPALA